MKPDSLRKILLLTWILVIHCNILPAIVPNDNAPVKLPNRIYSGLQGKHHVQGIAIDREKGHMYFSFTTKLIKTDLQGNLIGSVEGLTGHLGCLTFNPENGQVYGSLEYKNDAIGKGIAGEEATRKESAFYIAIFDTDKITRPQMDAEKDGIMTTVYLKEVADDYYATDTNHGNPVDHRYGCSGIDGVSFAPKAGKKKGKTYLYVAYGIYGDNKRTDNDYQVLLEYDIKNWKKYAQALSQGAPHKQGPSKPNEKYFVFTGNTTYGIQNLAYDPASGNTYAAVYKGKKEIYPNYSLFVIDWNKPARKMQLKGFERKEVRKVLSLCNQGLYDKESGVYGWNFRWGATGLCPLGNGYFYISHDSNKPQQNSTVHLYKWTGNPDNPFQSVVRENDM